MWSLLQMWSCLARDVIRMTRELYKGGDRVRVWRVCVRAQTKATVTLAIVLCTGGWGYLYALGEGVVSKVRKS